MELWKSELASAKAELKKYQTWISIINSMDHLTGTLLELLDEYRDQEWRLKNEIKTLNKKIKEAEAA